MSEYQYYEFQAIDRPLTAKEREMLRGLSSRARITSTSFTNEYQWGDFKGDPTKLMAMCFDLHLYLANWGSRRLMIRFPKRLTGADVLDTFLFPVEDAEIHDAADNLILDIARGQIEDDDDDHGDGDGAEDGAGLLASLAPLRADLLAGDFRVLYMAWLLAVEDESLVDDAPEPLPGIGPLTGALEAFAAFFGLDPDLVEAAAERSATPEREAGISDAARAILAAIPEPEKTAWLTRLFEGDPHVTTELRGMVRRRLAATDAPPPAARTVGELRARAAAIREARERAEADKTAAEKAHRAREAEEARQARLTALTRRGESVWREVEDEIERRNASSYDRAASLLRDLRAVAETRGALADFARRLAAIRDRHARKAVFIERLKDL